MSEWIKITNTLSSYPPIKNPKEIRYFHRSESVLLILKNGEYTVSHWITYGKRRSWVDEGNPNWELLSKGWPKYWIPLPKPPTDTKLRQKECDTNGCQND